MNKLSLWALTLFLLAGCRPNLAAPPIVAPPIATPGVKTPLPPAVSVALAQNEKALLPIVTSAAATPRVKAAATALAEVLSRIAGAKFQTQTGDGKSGIVVGTVADFPGLGLEKELDAADPTRREAYVLRSHNGGVLLIGATDLAVEDAVWDFLGRLGYRQYFPGANWEIVPRTPDLKIAVNAHEAPDYLSRRIWFSYGTWPENAKRMEQWSERNRVRMGLDIQTTHAYGTIIAENKAEFDAHPEYFAEIDGKRDARAQGKFDISNPGLRELVKNWAIRKFEANPRLDSISLDPSDGGGWGDSAAERKLGSVSDRVVLLANEVAQAVKRKFPGRFVGIYAYNDYSPPPSIEVGPGVAVNVATHFLTGGYSVDELLNGWQKQGATIGIREYFSIPIWDNDLPAARATDPNYIARKLPHYYQKGARFLSAESGDNWAPNGLSYYLAARVLWDTGEASRADAIVDEFLQNCFGPARAPMREFYGALNGIGDLPRRPFSRDLVGRLYGALDRAFALAGTDEKIAARLSDLTLYARYLELYAQYTAAPPAEKAAAFETVVRFAYRTRDSQMIHSMGIYRELYRDKASIAKMPKNATWNIPEIGKDGQPLNPWKSSAPFTPGEIKTFIADGMAANPVVDITPKNYSRDLVPATALNLSAPRLPRTWLRGTQNFYLWLPDGQTEVHLKVKAGLTYANKGPAKLALYAGGESDDEAAAALDAGEDAPVVGAALDSAEVAPDKAEHEIVLHARKSGLHRLEVADGSGGTAVDWPDGLPVVIKADRVSVMAYRFRESFYFYVPRGTREIGGFAEGELHVYDPTKKEIWTQWKGEGYFKIPVPAGADGQIWRTNSVGSQFSLLTVPPYLARSGDELLLPAEVVRADGVK